MQELVWVDSVLTADEYRLWMKMNRADKRHSLDAGQFITTTLPENRDAVAAALMHDIGKIESGLSLFGRVLATLIRPFMPKGHISKWRGLRGFRGHYANYWLHNEIGAELLSRCGSSVLVIDWARQHSKPLAKCTIDPEIAAILYKSDDLP